MSSNLKKAGSNQRRSFIPMVVSLASGSFSWRFFVIDPAVLTYKTFPESIVNEEKNKPWYHFILSGGSI